MRTLITLLLLCLAVSAESFAQNSATRDLTGTLNSSATDYRLGSIDEPTMNAIKITEADLIILDGNLEESAWKNAPVATGFTQRFPVDGGTPSQKTEARILYTDNYIFVGIHAFETNMDSLNGPLFRRDGDQNSDWVYVSFDSYNDKRTAFTFAVNPRGVQKDILFFDDTGEDILWDAVWEAETSIHNEGWTVEMKIPLSQLRFSTKNEVQTWGVNFQRRISRNNEYNFWAPTSQKESGMVSKFGTLEGIRELEAPRRLEVTPYASTKLLRSPKVDPDNPYYNANEFEMGVGGDIKYGLSSDLTLTATINPDFGQVEADPSTINLSQFEIFFPERRPFFLEGNEIFRFGNTRTFNTAGNPITFYSRRIGRSPQGIIGIANQYSNGGLYDDNTVGRIYQDRPSQTNIAAAAKISGKTQSGWSIGILDAVTLEQSADFTALGQNGGSDISGSYAVEPATNYLVSRVKKDINEGNSVLGGFFSAVNRNIGDTYFDSYLANSAYLGGIDMEHNWKEREWVVSGAFSMTQINGSEETISLIQRAPQRYYQRVDSDGLSLDPTETNIRGFASEISLRKSSGDHWTGSLTYSDVSPGYETNDLGFQNRADYRGITTAIQYQETDPKRVQYYELWSYTLNGWNYDGDQIWKNYNVGGFMRFQNQWSFNMNVNASLNRPNDRLTRGGPLMQYNGDYNFNFNINTDRSKKFSFNTGQFHRRDISREFDDYYWFNVTYSPTTFIQFTMGPELGLELDEDQYIRTLARDVSAPDADQTFGNRYIFSDVRRMTLVSNIRLNWTFSPSMSLQTYVRPYVTSARFSNFGEFNDPGGFGFDRYGRDEGQITENGNGNYAVDIDEDGTEDFNFNRPDFTFRSIQGNAVFRWEYKPGSAFFLVWQQQRAGSIGNGEYNIGRDFRGIFDAKPTNVFLVKFSYWFGT